MFVWGWVLMPDLYEMGSRELLFIRGRISIEYKKVRKSPA